MFSFQGCLNRDDFNPRPRVGATLDGFCKRWIIDISIHAPAWGRQHPNERVCAFHQFQSTPPRGGDHCCPYRPTTYFYFNPRPRVGATRHI